MITAKMLKDFDDIPAGATVLVQRRWWRGEEGRCVLYLLDFPTGFKSHKRYPSPAAYGCPEEYLEYINNESSE